MPEEELYCVILERQPSDRGKVENANKIEVRFKGLKEFQ